jgi:hypothetical protein
VGNLVVVSAVQSWLGVSGNDGVLSGIIERAEDRINSLCDRENGFVSAEMTEKHNGDTSPFVQLKHWPIDSDEDVTVVVTSPSGDSATLGTSTYSVDYSSGVLRLVSTVWELWALGYDAVPLFPQGHQNISVTFTGGYAADAIPGDLEQAALELVAAMWFGRRGQDPTLVSENLGSYSYTRKGEADVISEMTRPGGLLYPYMQGVQ